MKTHLKVLLTILCSTIFIVSCSRKKNKFINRNFHALTAEFNTLYNGYNALEQGQKSLKNNYFDNYWEVLPVERMEVSEDVLLPGKANNPDFARAEEKAVKTIQKHGMNIKNKEYNPQIDEAYLLLGKARYFDQRFVPALESFNYILYKYPLSDKINQAKIWREKANIRLDNNELAIKNLKRLLKQEDLKNQELADATSILAQAYLNTKSIDSAVTQLEIASNATKNNDERGRYRFIQGQLYNKLGHKDSANLAFDKIIDLKRRTPRIYLISAFLEKSKNFDYKNGDKAQLIELFEELEENRENRPFLDKIYHQIANYHLKNGSDSLATAYYNKSLRTSSQDKLLNAKSYETIGDINFNNSIYRDAGEYYDSTMTNLTLNSKPYRVIKRKKDNLEDVILYESIAQVNDSILKLINLPEAARVAYFESYIQKLKEKAEKEEEERLKQEAIQRNSGSISPNKASGSGQPPRGNTPASAKFYFYNSTTVAYGKNEFIKNWGKRSLEDNWRWSKNNNSKITSTSVGVKKDSLLVAAPKEDVLSVDFYISKIPSAEKEIDSISKERNNAYYQLGLIYKEKFKEYKLSKDKFQDLLESNPKERFILPSKYNLYKIHDLLGEEKEALALKEEIIANYPESRYAAILKNPEILSERDENSAESLYEALYEKYENQEYAEVISKCEKYLNVFDGDAIMSKFDFLKATAIARLHGFEAYSEALNQIKTNYANTIEGIKAQDIEENVLPNLRSQAFVKANDTILSNYKVIFKFKSSEPEKISDFQKVLDESIKKIGYYKLRSSVDVYNPDTNFVIVHGLKNEHVAKTFDQLLFEDDKEKIKEPYFVISSKNYKIVQVHKNLDAFLNIDTN